jgi:hypothetical protein
MRHRLPGTWSSCHARLGSGAFASQERVSLPRPVVDSTLAGARDLGERYWREVERSTGRLVRARAARAGHELLLFGVGPPLLRFGDPELSATANVVTCVYAIAGGLLARVPAGSLSFGQAASDRVELSASICGFYPRLAFARAGRNGGVLYRLQARVHTALARRYFARLWREAA